MCNLVIRLILLICCLPTVAYSTTTVRSIHVEWGYTPPSIPTVTGFKLYQQGVLACQTKVPTATALDCTVSLTVESTNFTLTATFNDGTESPHSSPYIFTLPQSATSAGDTSTTSLTTTGKSSPSVVISSSQAAGTSPLTVNFNGTKSTASTNASITSYSWNFGDGSSGTGANISHTYTSPGAYKSILTVIDSKGLVKSADTPVVVSAAVTPDKSGSSDAAGIDNQGSASSVDKNPAVQGQQSQAALNIESGEITVTSNWVRVPLSSNLANPIVVVGPPSFNNSDPCVVRIRNVGKTGFEIRLTEWNHQDGLHPAEIVSYLVMEKGRTILPDGSMVEAGSFTGTINLQKVSFCKPFNRKPVVMTTIASVYEADTISGHLENISLSGFAYHFREQRKDSNIHAPETINFVAWEPGAGTVGSVRYEAAAMANVIFESRYNQTFQYPFKQAPQLLADMQTTGNSDTSALRVQRITPKGFLMQVEKERSLNKKWRYRSETIGYLILSSEDE